MNPKDNRSVSPVHYARELGRRFEALGLDVHASENERYLVLLQDAPGEIIDLGRPLRSSRIFAHEAIRKNVPVVSDFAEFSVEHGLENCMFWNVGLTGAKAAADDLAVALKDFNTKINIEFSELRKKLSFELLLITIHPRFDMETGLFDLHAHFICRVPPEYREAAHRRLMSKFSKIDLNTKPIRNPAAAATYMLWGIWQNDIMLSWPDHALRAAWSLTQKRFRLFRTGGAFAKWRAQRRSKPAKLASTVEKEKIKKNREATSDKRQHVQNGDKLLSKVMVRRSGKKVAALLYETRRQKTHQADKEGNINAIGMYTSATIRVTQDNKGSFQYGFRRNETPQFSPAKAAQGYVQRISDTISQLKLKTVRTMRSRMRHIRNWVVRFRRK